jgi:hypothetical protein
MSDYDIEFEELILEQGDKRVTWEWIGEGNEGDYNPDDPDDEPLLRFSCSKYTGDGEWEGMEDASYCTALPITTPRRYLAIAASIVLEAIDTNSSYKRELEHLSWFCLSDFEEQKSRSMKQQPSFKILY